MTKLEQIFAKADTIRGKNPDVWRKDCNGDKIRFGSHGCQSQFGWEIDHKNPKANGGSDKMVNLQPLFWETNRAKSDTYPYKK